MSTVVHLKNPWRISCTYPVQVFLASVIIALAFPALILSLSCHSQCDTQAESKSVSSLSHHLIMVVCYACAACAGGPTYFTTTYFTTYKCAVVHYASSVAFNQSQRGIATVVLCNSPADVDTGRSGAASAGYIRKDIHRISFHTMGFLFKSRISMISTQTRFTDKQ